MTTGSRPARRVEPPAVPPAGRGRQARDRVGDGCDVRRRGAAAAAGDVEEAVLRPFAQGGGHRPRASRRSRPARWAGPRSGRPRPGDRRCGDRTSRCSRSCFGPSAQFRPTISGSAWRTLFQNASTVWPDSVRPEASTIVPEMISGSRSPSSSNSDSTAKIAALALSVSKIVSISRRSAPPSTSPAADSR